MTGMVTMKDVAAAAEVSRVTVSFVLNNRHADLKISEKTCQKVKEVAKRLGYRKNELARSMVTGKTSVIGFIGASCWIEYSAKIIEGAMIKAGQKGYLLKLIPWEGTNVSEVVGHCVEQRLSGVICRSLDLKNMDEIYEELKKYNIPLAESGESLRLGPGLKISSDDRNGVRLALEHLRDLGHRKIFFGNLGVARSGYSEIRRDYYFELMEEFGFQGSDELFVPEDNNYEFSKRAAKILTQADRPTAFFCSNETSAMLCLRSAHELGVKVPEELSVIGYGDSLMSQYASPALTVVRQPFQELGETVVEALIDIIEAKDDSLFNKSIEKKMPVTLIVRNSTAVAPKGTKIL